MSHIPLSGNLTRDAWLALANAAQALQKVAQLALGENLSTTDAHALILSPTVPHAGMSVAEGINQFLIAKARLKKSDDRYVRTLRNSLSKFAKGRSHAPLDSITPEQIEHWLADSDWAAGTQEGYLSDVSIFYNFAKRRGWCSRNPASLVELPEHDEGPVAVHSPEQVRVVMAKAREFDLDVHRAMALRYFAGLRAIEAEHQSESDIHLEEGFLKVTRAKKRTRARRTVTIVPALNAFLGVGGSLPLRNAGQKMAELARLVTAKGVPFGDNQPRHSFCSYHLAFHENAAKTAREAGHSEQILFNRYNGEVLKKDAEDYWGIRPI